MSSVSRLKPPPHWRVARRTIDLSRRGLIMGILNVTPDSFSDGGRFDDLRTALAHARAMISGGADIIDIGGESTRPGAAAVSTEDESARVLPVIEALAGEAPDCLISIDTSKSEVARAALDAGAVIVNDVTGLRSDPAMAEVAARHSAGVIIMHMKGTPRSMQADPQYDDVVEEVRAFFSRQFDHTVAAGVDPASIVFDPGIGFGKTLEHNLALLRWLDRLSVRDRPLAIGLSRKSFIGRILGTRDLEDRSWPTVALTSYARERGALIHRVHDVRPNAQALRMTEAILAANP